MFYLGGGTYVTNSRPCLYKICPRSYYCFLNNMALKKVRFAYANTYHRPYSLPPHLSHSASTLTSSLGPVTPPNAPVHLPYDPRYPPKYPPKAHSARYPPRPKLHRYLAPNAILWALGDHHSAASRGRGRLSETTLFDPACDPPLPVIHIFIHMRVSFPHPHPFWTCEVRASNRRYVNVLDVLQSLYKFLRGNVTQLEFNALSDGDRMVATQAYQSRYRRHQHHDHDAYLSEKSRGMKRIDFLMGHTRFAGLSERRQPHEFDLQVT